jgi:aldose 1-epimerase
MFCGVKGFARRPAEHSRRGAAMTIDKRLFGYTKDGKEVDTPISLTSHSYFNLGGHNSGSAANHRIQIFSQAIAPVDETLIPTGDLLDVTNTPFNLREPKTLDSGLTRNHPQMVLCNGYDHCFVLSHAPKRDMAQAAILEYNGLSMACLTTQPGLQLYSGNHLSVMNGKNGASYSKCSGLCLETQNWPDAINHPGFPDCVLKKGETYRHKTVYAFKGIGPAET